MSTDYGITNIYDANLFSLSEEDIKNRYITPAIEAKGWTKNQTRMEYTIMEGTTVIGEHAFARCNNMSTITIVESVQSISDMAFWDCSKLTSVRLPEGCAVSPKAFFGIVVNFV